MTSPNNSPDPEESDRSLTTSLDGAILGSTVLRNVSDPNSIATDLQKLAEGPHGVEITRLMTIGAHDAEVHQLSPGEAYMKAVADLAATTDAFKTKDQLTEMYGQAS